LDKLLLWKNMLTFKIDGDFIAVDDISVLNETLDKQFAEWNSKESSKEGKMHTKHLQGTTGQKSPPRDAGNRNQDENQQKELPNQPEIKPAHHETFLLMIKKSCIPDPIPPSTLRMKFPAKLSVTRCSTVYKPPISLMLAMPRIRLGTREVHDLGPW